MHLAFGAPIDTLSNCDLVRLVGGARAVSMLQQTGSLRCLMNEALPRGRVDGIVHAKLYGSYVLARRIVMEDLQRVPLTNPASVREYLSLALATKPCEVFMSLYLDSQSRLIVAEESFRGTLGQTSVYPREIVKRALELNAGAVIFAHSHPSGVAEPSDADRQLTDRLQRALALVDVRVLDHFIVAGSSTTSFSERGLL